MSTVKLPSAKVLHDYYVKTTQQWKEEQREEHPFFKSLCVVENQQDQEEIPAYFDTYAAIMKDEEQQAYQQYQAYQLEVAYDTFCLRYFQNQSALHHFNHKQTTTPETRIYRHHLQQLQNEFEERCKSNPFLLEVVHKEQLKQDLQSVKNHELIEVPYVKRIEKQILDGLYQGIPVYLVGHLGSGKTQLAMEVAKKYQIEKMLQKKYEKEMERFALNHPNFTKQEAFQYFQTIYLQYKDEYQAYYESQDPILRKKFEPYFISGSHNLTYEDMFVEKTLALSTTYREDCFQEYLNRITEDFESWLNDHRELLEGMSREEQLQLKVQIWKTCSQLFVAGNSSFGTIVEKQEREILKALLEGKVIIVDEMNTIAMQNLIGLNDILQKHVYETAYVTGYGPVEIQDGFALIGTGNLSTKKVEYEGTNHLNPAFQSRFLSLEYQYVPNAIEKKKTRDYEEDQLYRILLTMLLEEDGSLYLADSKKNFNELYQLAIFAKRSQNIFCGIYQTKEAFENPPVLHESVLSMRNLIRVLDFYQHGEAMDLSYALWVGFLSSVQNSDDRNLLMALAYQSGFFTKEEGWNVPLRGTDEPGVTYEELRSTPYVYEMRKMDHLTIDEVLKEMYGKSIYETRYPKAFLQAIQQENKNDCISKNEFEEYEKTLQHFEHTVDIYHMLDSEERKEN